MKQRVTVEAPEGPTDQLGAIEAMLGKAKLLNPPPTAKVRVVMTMGGKVRALTLEWDQ